MAIRSVLRLPHEVLSRPAQPADLTVAERAALAADLIETMRASPACVGLAAPQIGVARRVFVVDVTGHPKTRACHGEFVVFDPRLLALEGAVKGREGCMSVPDLTGDVVRAARIVVAGQTVSGDELVIETDAFEARAVLHEMDHLDGKLFLDRVSGPAGIFRRKTYR